MESRSLNANARLILHELVSGQPLDGRHAAGLESGLERIGSGSRWAYGVLDQPISGRSAAEVTASSTVGGKTGGG